MYSDLVHDLLPDLEVDTKNKLLAELEKLSQDFAIGHISGSVAHAVLKSVDGLIAASLKVVDKEQALILAQGFSDEVDVQMVHLQDALVRYIPLQVNVEVAKKQFGDHSADANAAREKRKVGITEVKEDVGNLMAAFVGKHVSG